MNISGIYLITDVLITDYLSVMFDYACVKKINSDEHKPMIFFPYDLEDYRDNLRCFNIDLETPGPVLLASDEVIDAVKNIKRTEDAYRTKYDERPATALNVASRHFSHTGFFSYGYEIA